MVGTAIQIDDISPLGAIFVCWLLFLPYIFITTRYRIELRDGTIFQKAAGIADVSIKLSDVTFVRLETSDAQTLLSMRRPFRRITIYAKGGERTKFIDVSLKHFAADDIRQLMRAIHDGRPDLALSKHWI
jgi:hypothetical protein